MIKHHPNFELLKSFVAGDLPASLSAAVAVHADMCPACQQHIEKLTQSLAETCFEQQADNRLLSTLSSELDTSTELAEVDCETMDFEAMIQDITQSDDLAAFKPVKEKSIQFKGQTYPLPQALSNMPLGKTANIGKLSRSRVQLEEGDIHTSLLHIEPGGSVPAHTHKGFELTLLLDGSFSDEDGEYHAGDFIMLDARHQHQPISAEGCLCYTVVNDSLHFTRGINKLLNPIGSLIY